MPRISRHLLPGNFFHIMVQGINKEPVFQKHIHKTTYLNIIQNKLKDYNIQIIAYCIMSNHVHLLIYSENIDDIINFMQKINTIYAIYYNKINERVGYVFRDRYKTQPIKDYNHLHSCIVYIHKNPTKAHIVDKVEDYPFSSYNEFRFGNKRNLLTDDGIKLVFGTSDFNLFFNDFLAMHHFDDLDEFFLEDINDIDYNDIIQKYKSRNLSTNEIILALSKNHNLSNRIIANLLNVTRYKVEKTLKK